MRRREQSPAVLTAPRSTLKRRGSTLIEFALIVPVLIAMLMGIIEFGWLVKSHLTIANAAREGARVASLGRTDAEIRERIRNSMAPIVLRTSTNDKVTLERSSTGATGSWTAFPADNTSVTPPENGVKSGDLIRVTIDVAHDSLTGMPYMNNKRTVVPVTMVREKQKGP